MKLVKKQISEKDGAGSVTLLPEDPEDMWHVYNLILPGDSIRTTTVRKVVKEGATGSTSSQRVRMTLTIEVISVDFDTDLCVLRLKGKNIEESQHVKMGAFHTIDLELNRNFTLTKEIWDQIAIERLDLACNVAKQADVAAVVMHPGLAHICLIKGHMTVVRAKIDISIPRKRTGSSGHSKAMQKFYDTIMQSIIRHVDFNIVKCVLIASPGFLRDDFLKYMMAEAVRRDVKVLLENKSKFTLCHASSGHKHALDEVLVQPQIQSQLQDTKAAEDVKILGEFFEMLNSDSDRAVYGYKHVATANEQLAIDKMLITDNLFRNQNVAIRRKYVNLVESVRDNGGEVRIFSSMHVSGEQLSQMSGIVAMLRFPIHGLDDEDSSDDDSTPVTISNEIITE